MAEFQESGWTLDFDDTAWTRIVKWDDDPCYRQGIERMKGKTRRRLRGCGLPRCHWRNGSDELVDEGTRAVDFAAIGPGRIPWLVEVKSLRGDTATMPIEERAVDIAAKVRDSLCGVEWARPRSAGFVPSPDLQHVRRALGRATTVRVLVLFDDLRPGSRTQTLALQAKLRELLIWLRGDVVVYGHQELPGELGLAVS